MYSQQSYHKGDLVVAGAPDEMKLFNKMESDNMLKSLPLMEDIANITVFLATDIAGKITGVTIDVTCEKAAGLNYRATSDILF